VRYPEESSKYHADSLQCEYPEIRRIRGPSHAPHDPETARHPSASSSHATESALPLLEQNSQQIPQPLDTHLIGIDRTIPEIKGYLENKGYDHDPDQASALAYMSALLRTTKVAQVFFGGDEPWVLLRELCDGEEELHCVRSTHPWTPL
jgi:hypothetical protein